jgi:hypothetical protein
MLWRLVPCVSLLSICINCDLSTVLCISLFLFFFAQVDYRKILNILLAGKEIIIITLRNFEQWEEGGCWSVDESIWGVWKHKENQLLDKKLASRTWEFSNIFYRIWSCQIKRRYILSCTNAASSLIIEFEKLFSQAWISIYVKLT